MRAFPQVLDTGADRRAGEDAFIAFQNLTPDGFMMFRPVRSEDGSITDLEWIFVNEAAGAIVGKSPDELLGKHLLVEMPGNRDEGLFDAYVEVIESGETWQNEFFYDHGGITAWFRTTAVKAGHGLALSFADISEVRKGDERLRSLLDGVLAFVGVLSVDGTLLEANEPAVAAAGLERNQLIGQPFWECYWWAYSKKTKSRLQQAVAKAAKGEIVRYDAKIRIAGDRRMWIDFQIAPVFDETGAVTELIPSGVDITERKRAEDHKELLIKELSHRVKNSLATIQSMARQTIKSAASLEEFRTSFSDRLHSMAASHDLLVEAEHHTVSLAALIRGQVLPLAAGEERLELRGSDILVPGDVAHLLGMVLHELATNASKHGAFSTEGGKVTVEWSVEVVKKARTLSFSWFESGGPKVSEPKRQGFGMRLIERSLAAGEDGAVIAYRPEGLSCKLKMAL